MQKLKSNIVFLVLTILLMLVWFRRGLMYGGGETQIPFFHPEYLESITNYTWNERIGLGVAGTVWFSSRVFFDLVSFIHSFAGPVATQAIFFGSLFYLASYYSYRLSKEFFNKPEGFHYLVAFSYVFNPFVMATVWHRFLLPIMAQFGVIPLLLWIFVRGIKRKNLLYAFLIPLVTTVYGILFLFPGSTVTIFLPIAIYAIYYFIISNKTEKNWILGFSLFSAVVWLASNAWWIYPFLSTSTQLLENAGNLESYLGSLRGVSERTLLSDSLRVWSSHYFLHEKAWGDFYENSWVLLLSWLGPLVAIWGGIKARKEKWVGLFLIIFTVGVFLSKGTNPPLGEGFYYWLFDKVPQSRIFRNPHEKIGVLMPLGYSVLFAFGVLCLWRQMGKRWKIEGKAVVILILFLVIGLFNWPMWVGNVINFSVDDPALVAVPVDYEDLNKYLARDKTDFRILMMPLMGHGIFNTWENGYRGGEASRDLLGFPTLGRTISMPNQVILDGLSTASSEDWFYKYVTKMNIKYIVVRKDITEELFSKKQMLRLEENLDKRSEFEFLQSFGELALFQAAVAPTHLYASAEISQYENPLEVATNTFSTYVASGDASQIDTLDSNDAHLKVTKNSPISYQIISEHNGRYLLVFSENYHTGWVATSAGRLLNHIRVNGFANGFVVEKKDEVIDIFFIPQKQFEKGRLVGGIILPLAFIAILAQRKINGRSKN